MNNNPASPDISELVSYAKLLNEEFSDEDFTSKEDDQETTDLGNPQAALKVGDPAPEFSLIDTRNSTFSLSSQLKNGPVVVSFYRGGWCPFCNVYLRALQLARPQIRALGAQVVLISPQRTEYAEQLAEQHTLLFPLLTDVGNRIARQYQIAFQISPKLREEYQSIGVDFRAINTDQIEELPMPATFVIDQQQIIQYAFVSSDFTQRAEPAEIIQVLRQLKNRR